MCLGLIRLIKRTRLMSRPWISWAYQKKNSNNFLAPALWEKPLAFAEAMESAGKHNLK